VAPISFFVLSNNVHATCYRRKDSAFANICGLLATSEMKISLISRFLLGPQRRFATK
jgi:hypothetical protein